MVTQTENLAEMGSNTLKSKVVIIIEQSRMAESSKNFEENQNLDLKTKMHFIIPVIPASNSHISILNTESI